MGRANNQMVTFRDLDWMVSNEDFIESNPFLVIDECPTKAECSDALFLDESGAEWISWASNRLVPYRLLVPAAPVWVGVGAICEEGSAPVDNPPTAPTLVLTSKTDTTITINWTANPGTDDNGIVEYRLGISSDGSNYHYQTVTGTVFTHTGLIPNNTYYYQNHAVDTINQYSPVSNTLSVTTDTPTPGEELKLFVSDANTAADKQYASVTGPAGDQVTMKLTVHTGSTGSCSKKWKYIKLQPITKLIDGADFPSLPYTHTWNVTIPQSGGITILEAFAYRTYPQVGFSATTTGTIEIIATDGAEALPPSVPIDINASGALGC